MRASVIIPCRNGARTLPTTLESVFRQTFLPDEVIVVDDASEDETAAVAEAAGARVIRNAVQRNAGGARNAGIDVATGEMLAFLDSDAEASSDWLERANGVLERDPSIAGVGGRILNGRPDRYGSLDYYMNHSEWMTPAGEGEKRAIPTMGIVYRKSAVGDLRFPESNWGEDTAFALAIQERGGTLWYDPGITITHRHERLDYASYRRHQVACGKTIYWTRAALDRPGKFLVRWPATLFLFPHLWLMILRMIRAGYAWNAIRWLPWLVAGEFARIEGFFEARRMGVPEWFHVKSKGAAA